MDKSGNHRSNLQTQDSVNDLFPFSSNVNSMSLSVLMKYIYQNPSTSKNVRFYKTGILKHYIEILKSWRFEEGSLLRIWE